MIVHTYNEQSFVTDFLLASDKFSINALKALFNYYDSMGNTIEFDPVAMYGAWGEYGSITEAIYDYYGGDLDHAQDMTELYAIRRQERGETRAQALESVLGVAVIDVSPKSILVGV